MKTFDELRDSIIKNRAFSISIAGTADTGEPVYFSEGIKRTYKEISAEDIQAALNLFLSGDYGTFYSDDEQPTPGGEYGEYKSIYGTDKEAIKIHREGRTIKIYFQFER